MLDLPLDLVMRCSENVVVVLRRQMRRQQTHGACLAHLSDRELPIPSSCFCVPSSFFAVESEPVATIEALDIRQSGLPAAACGRFAVARASSARCASPLERREPRIDAVPARQSFTVGLGAGLRHGSLIMGHQPHGLAAEASAEGERRVV